MKSQVIKKIISLVLCAVLYMCNITVCVSAETYEIDDWYVNDTSAKRFFLWNTIPSTVYTYKFSGMSDYFVSGVNNGVTKWKNGLSINMGYVTTVVDDRINNGIKIFGGTEEQLNSLGIWDNSIIYDESVSGYTSPSATLDQNNAYVITYPAYTTYINVYIAHSMNIFVKKRSVNELSKYYHLCTHELGHALGWYGHTYDTNSVMYFTGPTNLYTLSNVDINHIKQFYD